MELSKIFVGGAETKLFLGASIPFQGAELFELFNVLGDDLMDKIFKLEKEVGLKLVVLLEVSLFLVPVFGPGGSVIFKVDGNLQGAEAMFTAILF